jgi:DNA-binding SARP family transcriptional activator
LLEVRSLGRFEIKANGKIVVISSCPALNLFAYLVLNAGTSYRREKLAGLLWLDSLEGIALDNLHHALWRLRKGLHIASFARLFMANDLTIGITSSSAPVG